MRITYKLGSYSPLGDNRCCRACHRPSDDLRYGHIERPGGYVTVRVAVDILPDGTLSAVHDVKHYVPRLATVGAFCPVCRSVYPFRPEHYVERLPVDIRQERDDTGTIGWCREQFDYWNRPTFQVWPNGRVTEERPTTYTACVACGNRTAERRAGNLCSVCRAAGVTQVARRAAKRRAAWQRRHARKG